MAARDVDIEVRGDRSVGIGAGRRYEGTGDIVIDVRVDGGTITAQGPGSSGVLVGLAGGIFDDRTRPIKAPAGGEVEVDRGVPGGSPGAAGNPAQSVMVNGRVRGGTGVGAGGRRGLLDSRSPTTCL